jgi:hypothetical protein
MVAAPASPRAVAEYMEDSRYLQCLAAGRPAWTVRDAAWAD